MVVRSLTLVQPVAEDDKENLRMSRIGAMICAATCMAVAAVGDLIFWVNVGPGPNYVLRTSASLLTVLFTLAVLAFGASTFVAASRPETGERLQDKEALYARIKYYSRNNAILTALTAIATVLACVGTG